MQQNMQCRAMNQLFLLGLLGIFLAAGVRAQSSAPQSPPPAQKPTTDANPFPEDTNNVPVMPTNPAALLAPPPQEENAASALHVAAIDTDPVRSPDDEPVTAADGAGDSSSSAGLDKILGGGGGEDNGPQDRKHRHERQEPEKKKSQKDIAADDLNVGGYYLEKKNWKAAQSRFQSAMVMDPENPEVYWGLAEAAFHLGDLFTARRYYLKVADYDPDGPHGRQLKKILKDPALLSAKQLPPTPAVTTGAAAPEAPKP
jgi:tetratricopeptide (TPR) repeat protein